MDEKFQKEEEKRKLLLFMKGYVAEYTKELMDDFSIDFINDNRVYKFRENVINSIEENKEKIYNDSINAKLEIIDSINNKNEKIVDESESDKIVNEYASLFFVGNDFNLKYEGTFKEGKQLDEAISCKYKPNNYENYILLPISMFFTF